MYQGHLRVVTTENNRRLAPKNKIFVLRVPESGDAPSEMIRVGESGHVGKPNDFVYSVRFIGPRAYIVTFERYIPVLPDNLLSPLEPLNLLI